MSGCITLLTSPIPPTNMTSDINHDTAERADDLVDSAGEPAAEQFHVLTPWGWRPELAEELEQMKPGAELGRVVSDKGTHLEVQTAAGRLNVNMSLGDWRNEGRPVVGDWLVTSQRDSDDWWVDELLARHSWLRRRRPKRLGVPHYLAANIDVVALVMSMNKDFCDRRLARFLVAINEGHAKPLLLLTKSDLIRDPNLWSDKINKVTKDHPTLPLYKLDARSPDSVSIVKSYLSDGETMVLVGSSGVGKSTIINTLLGYEHMETAAIRARDDRGKHTTTYRELIPLPDNSGLIIDTPGVREIEPWSLDDEHTAAAFPRLIELAKSCGFTNCIHSDEPGCAVTPHLEDDPSLAKALHTWRLMNGHTARSSDRRAPRIRGTKRSRK